MPLTFHAHRFYWENRKQTCVRNGEGDWAHPTALLRSCVCRVHELRSTAGEWLCCLAIIPSPGFYTEQSRTEWEAKPLAKTHCRSLYLGSIWCWRQCSSCKNQASYNSFDTPLWPCLHFLVLRERSTKSVHVLMCPCFLSYKTLP